MEEGRGRGLTGLAAWSGLALSVAAIVWNGAVISANAADTRRRVETLEDKYDKQIDAINRIDNRTAKIETKLEILLPTQSLKELEARR